jgi:hypothetical protein
VQRDSKTYGREVGNPEIDQLSGRFSRERGRMGVALYLTCRPRFVCFQQLACCTKPEDTALTCRLLH